MQSVVPDSILEAVLRWAASKRGHAHRILLQGEKRLLDGHDHTAVVTELIERGLISSETRCITPLCSIAPPRPRGHPLKSARRPTSEPIQYRPLPRHPPVPSLRQAPEYVARYRDIVAAVRAQPGFSVTYYIRQHNWPPRYRPVFAVLLRAGVLQVTADPQSWTVHESAAASLIPVAA